MGERASAISSDVRASALALPILGDSSVQENQLGFWKVGVTLMGGVGTTVGSTVVPFRANAVSSDRRADAIAGDC